MLARQACWAQHGLSRGGNPQVSRPSIQCSSGSQQAQRSTADPSNIQQDEIRKQLQQMQQLLQQQSSTIAALQREVQHLKYQATRNAQTATMPYAAAIGNAAPTTTTSTTTATTSGSSNNGSGSYNSSSSTTSSLYGIGDNLQPLSTSYKFMTLEDFRALPDHIVLVRHAQSMGNLDATTYSQIPDYEVPLSPTGWEQATACGDQIKSLMEAKYGDGYKLFFFTSPYCRSRQTFVAIRQAFRDRHVGGIQEEVQLREQDFGNFQHPEKIKADIEERNRFGRFYFRFPDGESGSDVYNRISIFEDHLIRDMKAGKFGGKANLVLVTHGLTLRVFLMRWFNWTVESFLQAYNPPNATPILVTKVSEEEFLHMSGRLDKRQTLQVKQAYRLEGASMARLGLTTSSTMEVIDLIGQEYMT